MQNVTKHYGENMTYNHYSSASRDGNTAIDGCSQFSNFPSFSRFPTSLQHRREKKVFRVYKQAGSLLLHLHRIQLIDEYGQTSLNGGSVSNVLRMTPRCP